MAVHRTIWNLPKVLFQPFESIEDDREIALVCSAAAFAAVADRLRGVSFVSRIEPLQADLAHWDALLPDVRGEVIYAVGGGLAVDAAKYFAIKHELPLVSLPTALSVDAFLTWASGVRREGCVYYIETKPPEILIVDFEVLAYAPASIRAAGICDVLSIATGSADWRLAHEHGKNPPHAPYIRYADDAAAAILAGALECAEAAGRGDAEGLKQLLDCLALEVQLCNQLGHSRPEEGSEHYFAYAVENVMGKGLPHGDLVGPGILVIAALQGLDWLPLKRALQACNIPLTNIPEPVIRATLAELPAYATRHGLAWGIAHTLESRDLPLPSLE